MNGYSITTGAGGRSPWQATTELYSGALRRWLDRQRQMTQQFGRAEEPIREELQLYAPGGGYGAGQRGIAEEQMKTGRAEALHRLVATGMSSGSLATGVQIQARRGLEQAYRGIEDVRTERYGGALGRLASLRAGLGQLYGTIEEPSYAPAVGAYTSMYGADIGLAGQQLGQWGETQRLGMQISSAEKLAKLRRQQEQQHFNIQRLDITGSPTTGSTYVAPNIQMGPGYGPAFQSKTKMARIAAQKF